MLGTAQPGSDGTLRPSRDHSLHGCIHPQPRFRFRFCSFAGVRPGGQFAKMMRFAETAWFEMRETLKVASRSAGKRLRLVAE
jgi:hypothetical protein